MKVTGPSVTPANEPITDILDGAQLAGSIALRPDQKMARILNSASALKVELPDQTLATTIGDRELVISGVKIVGASDSGEMEVEIGDLYSLEGAK